MSHDTTSIALRQRPSLYASKPFGGSTRGSVRSLYVHIPFCSHKCHYCDFYSLVDRQDRQDAFLRRLVQELEAQAPYADALHTIFVGGGTPTLLRPDLWQTLLARLHDLFDIRSHTEFTVECNPETADPELFSLLKNGGVNRLSFGVQSFRSEHLRTLERLHPIESVPRALELARQAGIERRSIDLIYAIPGQTLADWSHDLSCALDLKVEHLSCYNLTYEPRTAMTARLERGEFEPLDEDIEIDMFSLTGQVLASAGFERYEISNYATPGRACRHNLAYWRQEQWLACGPSASAHVAGQRWKNTPHLDTYLTASDAGFSPIIDFEPPDRLRTLRERIMTGLRLGEGVDLAAFSHDLSTLAPNLAEAFDRELHTLESEGLIERADSRLRLRPQGFILADGIASRLMLTLI